MLGVCVVAFTKNKSSGKYTNRGNISHFAADQTQSLKVNKQMKFHYEAEKQLQVFLLLLPNFRCAGCAKRGGATINLLFALSIRFIPQLIPALFTFHGFHSAAFSNFFFLFLLSTSSFFNFKNLIRSSSSCVKCEV